LNLDFIQIINFELVGKQYVIEDEIEKEKKRHGMELNQRPQYYTSI
jgi:hypothetical protein